MLWMILGFGLACYAVIGNDSIQTLGTFLSSNRKKPWWLLWLYLGSILAFVLIYGWMAHNGDVSYGRLSKIPQKPPEWWHALPILVLLLLTRVGIPVSTTFMALSIFTGSILLEKIIIKSLTGYGVAFMATFIIWTLLAKFETRIFKTKSNAHPIWVFFQWCSTAFLWSQWLIQDLANIYVFVPREVPVTTLVLSLIFLLACLAYLIREKGGKIQNIVLAKTNTLDIRSATFIDFFYGLILFYFKSLNNLPMSTTWVFLGTLAGRELAITFWIKHKDIQVAFQDVAMDLAKASIGLIISVVLAFSGVYLFS